MGTDLLIQAFEHFRQASTSLERVHQELSRKVLILSQQLEEKNRELEKNLTEKEEIRSLLDNILSDLVNGVLVIDRGGEIKLTNKAFRSLMSGSSVPSAEAWTDKKSLKVVPAELLQRLRPIALQAERFTELTISDRVFLVSGTPFRPSTNDGELILFVFNDITELRALQKDRERQARLSAMGEMSIQLAHEIRNPLGGIQLYLSLLKSQNGSNPEGLGWIRNIEAGLASINYNVSNMLQFYKPLQMKPDFFAPSSVVEESIALLEPMIRTREVTVTCHDRYQGDVIHADREMLKQLCMNLLRNALNAIQEGGRITVELDGPLAGEVKTDQPMLRLIVRDNGIGMEPAEVERIFEPFWGAQTGGHGIGMWVSWQIIRQHHGHIKVQSQRGEGTGIIVHLPLQQYGEEQ